MMIFVGGCVKEDTIYGTYVFDRHVDGFGIVYRCAEGEERDYCSVDDISSIELKSDAIVFNFDFDENDAHQLEYDYELTEDNEILIEGLSTKESPTLQIKDGVIIIKLLDDD